MTHLKSVRLSGGQNRGRKQGLYKANIETKDVGLGKSRDSANKTTRYRAFNQNRKAQDAENRKKEA